VTVHALIWGDLPDMRYISYSVDVSNDMGDQAEVSRRHSSWRP